MNRRISSHLIIFRHLNRRAKTYRQLRSVGLDDRQQWPINLYVFKSYQTWLGYLDVEVVRVFRHVADVLHRVLFGLMAVVGTVFVVVLLKLCNPKLRLFSLFFHEVQNLRASLLCTLITTIISFFLAFIRKLALGSFIAHLAGF